MIKKLITRLKDILSIGSNYYHGELYDLFDDLFIKLEKRIITPEEAKKKINDLFHSNKSLQIQFKELINNSKLNLKIIGNKVSLFKRIRLLCWL